MARAVRKRKRASSRGRSLRRKRKRTKLADGKINTLIEKRMVAIARKEDRKNLFRNWKDIPLYGTYYSDHVTSGAYSPLGSLELGHGLTLTDIAQNTKILWDTLGIPVTKSSQGVGDDPLQTEPGTRSSKKVRVSGIEFFGHIEVPAGQPTSKVMMRLVRTRLTSNEAFGLPGHSVAGYMQCINNNKTTAGDLNRGFLKHKSSDLSLSMPTSQTVLTKVVTCRSDDKQTRVIPLKFRWFPKGGFSMEYSDGDIDGLLPLRKIFTFQAVQNLAQSNLVPNPTYDSNPYYDIPQVWDGTALRAQAGFQPADPPTLQIRHPTLVLACRVHYTNVCM